MELDLIKYILPLCFVFVNIFLTDVLTHLQTSKEEESETYSGYESCASVEKNCLNVHLVPYMKDSREWSEVLNGYMNITASSFTEVEAYSSLTAIIEELLNDSERRFIYSHTAFLLKWWEKQNELLRKNVRKLISEGRLEIVGGGWAHNDEAVTHYQSLIDQFTWGFKRLKDAFGPNARPKVGWQINSYGHSREVASLFAQMGFEGLFLGRVHYEEKQKCLANKTAEFIWEGSQILGKAAHIFTSILHNIHCPPPGFCSESLCADGSIVHDTKNSSNFIHKGVERFVEAVQTIAKSYKTNNILIPIAWDSYGQCAKTWFANLDKMNSYINKRHGTKVHSIYSTPSCYLKAVNNLNLTWSVRKNDFFPYASRPYGHTTGYYSSRPTHKYVERQGNNHLQICKQLSVFAGNYSNTELLNRFRETMGLMQHNEAVTGTGKWADSWKYIHALKHSTSQGKQITTQALRSFMQRDNKSSLLQSIEFHTCSKLNISCCEHTENNSGFVVTLYNPWSHSHSPYIRLPVRGSSYKVVDVTGKEVTTQIVPIHESVQVIPGRKSEATRELVFRAVNVSPLGYRSYHISESTDSKKGETITASTSTYIANEHCNISINAAGNVFAHWHKKNVTFEQSFHYYESSAGNSKEFANQASGAAVFRPSNSSCKNLKYHGSFKIYEGDLVQEIHHVIDEWVSQVIRLYKKHEHVEFNWLIGPLSIKDKIGKEFITRYSSNLQTQGKFYTDCNGREMIERKGYHNSMKYQKTADIVSQNYHPVTTKICLKGKDNAKKFTVLTDRSQGGSSLKNGQIELMLHRRTLKSDGIGRDQSLNDTAHGKGVVVRGIHHVIAAGAGETDSIAQKEKTLALKLSSGPWTFISKTNGMSFEKWNHTYIMKGSGIKKRLPENVHILTLEPWGTDKVLLRLEYVCESNTSTSTQINLKEILHLHTVKSVRETTLGGNQWKSDSKRMTWNSASGEYSSTTITKSSESSNSETTVTNSRTSGQQTGASKPVSSELGKSETSGHNTGSLLEHKKEAIGHVLETIGTELVEKKKSEATALNPRTSEQHSGATKSASSEHEKSETTGHNSGSLLEHKKEAIEHMSRAIGTELVGKKKSETTAQNPRTSEQQSGASKTESSELGKSITVEQQSSATNSASSEHEKIETTGHNSGSSLENKKEAIETESTEIKKSETTEQHSEATKAESSKETSETTGQHSEATKAESSKEKSETIGQHSEVTKAESSKEEKSETTEQHSEATKSESSKEVKNDSTGQHSTSVLSDSSGVVKSETTEQHSESVSSESSVSKEETESETVVTKSSRRKKRGTTEQKSASTSITSSVDEKIVTTESSEYTVTLSCMQIRTFIIETASQ